MRAIIFDCDGVLADSEPLHLAAFREVLAEEGLSLTIEEYLRHYLALDDRGCFTRLFADRGRPLSGEQLAALIRRKAERLEPVMRRELRLFDGVVEFVRAAAADFPLAVASGALRHEVELILDTGGIRDCFRVIVAAEDVTHSKPDPEPFLKACALLGNGLRPAECLVIEDSVHGVHAARQAGMRCLAVTTSYGREPLAEADRVVDSLAEVTPRDLARLFTSGH